MESKDISEYVKNENSPANLNKKFEESIKKDHVGHNYQYSKDSYNNYTKDLTMKSKGSDKKYKSNVITKMINEVKEKIEDPVTKNLNFNDNNDKSNINATNKSISDYMTDIKNK